MSDGIGKLGPNITFQAWVGPPGRIQFRGGWTLDRWSRLQPNSWSLFRTMQEVSGSKQLWMFHPMLVPNAMLNAEACKFPPNIQKNVSVIPSPPSSVLEKLKGNYSAKFLGGWNNKGSKSIESCEEGICNVGRMVALWKREPPNACWWHTLCSTMRKHKVPEVVVLCEHCAKVPFAYVHCACVPFAYVDCACVYCACVCYTCVYCLCVLSLCVPSNVQHVGHPKCSPKV